MVILWAAVVGALFEWFLNERSPVGRWLQGPRSLPVAVRRCGWVTNAVLAVTLAFFACVGYTEQSCEL